ncbi:MAG: InlB B-repeat-containing protein [Coriobacteriia bacterium]|nr:InlB B-repeat-containing protein [Coriobacteriia bacterium]
MRSTLNSLLLVAILLASILAVMTPGMALTTEPETWEVIFRTGAGSFDEDLVLEEVYDGTLISEIEPEFTPEPGLTFKGWTPKFEEDDVIDRDIAFTAVWSALETEIASDDGPYEIVDRSSVETTLTQTEIVIPTIPGMPTPIVPLPQTDSAEIGIVPAGDILTGWDVTFNVGTGGVGSNHVFNNVADGTNLNMIKPSIAPKPGYTFTGWSPAIGPSDLVTSDRTFTALWTYTTPAHDWMGNGTTSQGALRYFENTYGWTIPGDAMLLTFNNVSQNGHTFLDYVYMVISDEGDVSLYFLAFSDNKRFDDASSYMTYAGFPGTVIGVYNKTLQGQREMFCIYEVTIPAELVSSIIIEGMPMLTISLERSTPHSILNAPLRFMNINYQTQHWIYELDEYGNATTPVLRSTVPGVGVLHQVVTARPITIFGYQYQPGHPLEKLYDEILDISPPTPYTLRLYYQRSENITWTIRGISGNVATTTYNSEEQYLSDIIGSTAAYDIIFPGENPDAEYVFEPAGPPSGQGVYMADPHGEEVGVYFQNLELIPGYKVWYTVHTQDWIDNVLPTYVDNEKKVVGGVTWVNVADDLGPARVQNGSLTIVQRLVTITTLSASKTWDGSPLTKTDGSTYSKRSDPSTDPDEGLLDTTNSPKFNNIHLIEYDVTGTRTDTGTSPNGHSEPRIYYLVEEGGVVYEIDETHNYRFVSILGDLTVTPIITYEPNWSDSHEGTGTMGTTPVSYGQSVKLDKNTFASYLRTFNGWNTEPDGSGTAYTDEQEFTYLSDENMTLYAQWLVPADVKLTIEKRVTGKYGDKMKSFDFTVHFTDEHGDELRSSTVLDYLIEGPGIVDPSVQTMVLSGGDATFKLKHGQQITFLNVPSIVKFSITEDEDDNYITEFVDSLTPELKEKGTKTGSVLRSLTTEDRSFEFTNQRKDIVENGFSMGNIGDFLLFPVLTVALSLTAYAGKRRSVRKTGVR